MMTVPCRDANTASLQADIQPTDHNAVHRTVQPPDYNAVHRAVQPADHNAVHRTVQPTDHNAVHRAVQSADHNGVHRTVQPTDLGGAVQYADHNGVHRAVQSTDHTAVHHTDQGDAIVVNPVLWGQIAETLCEYGGGSSSDDSRDEPPQRSDDEPLPNSDVSMDELPQSSNDSMDSDVPSTSTAQPRKRANDMQATCHVCGRTFTSYKRLMGHHQANHLVMTLQCEECGRKFSSSKRYTSHISESLPVCIYDYPSNTGNLKSSKMCPDRKKLTSSSTRRSYQCFIWRPLEGAHIVNGLMHMLIPIHWSIRLTLQRHVFYWEKWRKELSFFS